MDTSKNAENGKFSDSERYTKLEFVVFGDDWGVHPSTAQHLILNLQPDDKVIWIDSIGMRNPKLNIADIRRFYSKGKAILRRGDAEASLYLNEMSSFKRIKPKVLPWHRNKLAVLFNKYSLSRSIRNAMNDLGMVKPVLVSSTPVVVKYLSSIPFDYVFYLRQDEYETYPGCDPVLVRETEPLIYDIAAAIFITAKSLLPGEEYSEKSHYLPHGVQLTHFSTVSLTPSHSKVLGFFGTIDERMDFQLVKDVAEAAVGWRLEFIGDILYKPSWIDSVENVHFLPMVPFQELPKYIANWAAGWTPYLINDVTMGINPLKIKEYLAAGLAAHCTPLPEAKMLNESVIISRKLEEIIDWLNDTYANDSVATREARRDSVSQDDWSVRSQEFRDVIVSATGEERSR